MRQWSFDLRKIFSDMVFDPWYFPQRLVKQSLAGRVCGQAVGDDVHRHFAPARALAGVCHKFSVQAKKAYSIDSP